MLAHKPRCVSRLINSRIPISVAVAFPQMKRAACPLYYLKGKQLKRMRPRTRNEATSPQKKGGNARPEIVSVYNLEKRKKKKEQHEKKKKKKDTKQEKRRKKRKQRKKERNKENGSQTDETGQNFFPQEIFTGRGDGRDTSTHFWNRYDSPER